MRKKLLLVVCAWAMFNFASNAQTTATGKVVDEKGAAIAGATVLEKGTSNGTTTSSDGSYSIKVKSGASLVISAIGFAEYNVKASSNQTSSLKAAADNISEVVVTALGFSSRKDKLASSQSTVKGTAIVNSGETSVLQGLAGKSSGVQVQRSGGDPGAGAYIQIRGQSTITGNTQPLIVIDGVPVFNSNLGQNTQGVVQQSRLSDINPSDIASLEVLKSAAAAGLWGTAAANGVILITTKKGRNSGKVNISFSSTLSFDKINKSVDLQTTYGQGLNGRFSNSSSSSWGDKIADRPGTVDIGTSSDYVLLADGSKRYLLSNGTALNPRGGKTSKDVYDHATNLFRTGTFYDNTISLSGGDEKSSFYASIGNLTQKGIAKAGSDYDRWSFRFNADRKFGDNLKLTAGLAYSNVSSNRIQQGSNLNGLFLGGLRSAPDFNNELFEGTYYDASGVAYPNRQVAYRNQIGRNKSSGYDNPFWIMNRIKNKTIVDRITANFEAALTLTKNLSLVERAGIDYYTDGRTEFFPAVASGGNNGGLYTNETVVERQFTNSTLLKYTNDLSKQLSLDLVVGHQYNSQYFSNVGASARNFILPDAPPSLANSPSDQRTVFNNYTKTRKSAFLAQANLAFENMLFLDLTARNEQASTYSGTFFFPSASLAWQFTKLKGLDNSNILTFGKLRTSWGKVGVEPGAYASSTYFLPLSEFEGWGGGLASSSGVYGGGYAQSSLQGNPNLKPEIKKEFEIGTDLRFWGNKVTLSATYYSNKTEGAIFSVQVPSSTGFDNTLSNAGTLENKGIELDLGLLLYKKKDLSISSNFIFSKNTNKVLSLKGTESIFLNGFTGSSSRAVEGHSVGMLWGEDFERNSSGVLLLDANGFPVGKAPNERIIGNSNPDWIGSAALNIQYKNFTIGAMFEHVQGGDVWNGTRGALNNFGKPGYTGNTTTFTKNLKTASGGTIASGTPFRGNVYDFGGGEVALTQAWYGSGMGSGFVGPGSQFVEKGTRTRLREISIGYTINGAGLRSKTKFQSIEISISGRNLALWTNYTGIDPETNLTGPSNGRGLDYFNNPSTRSYFFTVKVNY